MSKQCRIRHEPSGVVLVEHARWCDTFWSRLRGFTGRRDLAPGEGLVLVERAESRVATAIHMLFVFTDLGVLWVNDAGEVVDAVRARPWRLSYTPQAPARYVVEGDPGLLARVALGDRVRFEFGAGEEEAG